VSINNSFKRIGCFLSRVGPTLRDSIFAFLFLITAADALCAGLGRLNEARATAANDLDAANKAVLFAPTDPVSYRTRAAVLLKQGRADEAVGDAKRAVQLSPRDYALWENLANALQRRGDISESIDAYREATRLAPEYSEVRWSFGECLLKVGRTNDAFAEFRRASTKRTELFLRSADLAWEVGAGDARFVIQATNPRTNKERYALSAFLFHRGKTQEATAVLRAIDTLTEQDRLAFVVELITAGRFRDAQLIWSNSIGGQINDGGFEHSAIVDDGGFGWQFQRYEQSFTATLDVQNPRAGTKSLRLDWKGQSAPALPLVNQLVLVDPESRYQLRFAVRSDRLVTAGSPVIEVLQATGNVTQSVERGALLGRSEAIHNASSGWQEYKVDFETGKAQAVFIVVCRENCREQLCPIFGSAWFDDFQLTKLS
jgi:tetratricopeptide (TPR) repeat protein